MVTDGWDAPELAGEQPDEEFLCRADPRALEQQLVQLDRSGYGFDRLGAAVAVPLLVGGSIGGALGWWSQ